VFADGEAEGTFRVMPEADPTNPATGDSIGRWAVTMVLSMAGAVALLILGRKKRA